MNRLSLSCVPQMCHRTFVGPLGQLTRGDVPSGLDLSPVDPIKSNSMATSNSSQVPYTSVDRWSVSGAVQAPARFSWRAAARRSQPPDWAHEDLQCRLPQPTVFSGFAIRGRRLAPAPPARGQRLPVGYRQQVVQEDIWLRRLVPCVPRRFPTVAATGRSRGRR